MKKVFLQSIFVYVLLLLASASVMSQAAKPTLTTEELKLYKLVMAYRAKNGLGAIPLSASLTTVAHLHVQDLENNHPDSAGCNMHSWSKGGDKWQGCCYTPDHQQKYCMWDKPKELTTYTGKGYEIAVMHPEGITATEALDLWKQSVNHNAVVLNSGAFKEKWNAMGIGIYKKYAVIWFGKEVDKEGGPGR